MTPLGRALLGIDHAMPPAFRAVDRRIGAGRPPDLVEHSIAVRGERVCPWRATYYYDDDEDGAYVGATIAELAKQLSIPAPAVLTQALDDPCVLQHVIGVDADARVRLKRYVVFRHPDRAYVEHLLARLSQPAPELDAGRVYILGFDLDATGLADVKLYFKLERAKVAGFLRGRDELKPLLRASREVVFGHRLGGGSRTMYFHADGPGPLRQDLARRAVTSTAAALAETQLVAIRAAHLMDPWIAGVPYAEAGLSPNDFTLYLHPASVPRRGGLVEV